MSDRVCGCNVVTAAGITTALQMVILLLALSSTGLVLDRYRLWQAVEPRSTATAPPTTGDPVDTDASRWSEAWLELAMAWYVAFACFWLFTLFVVCLSFKYYRPVFVVPNFIALVVGIFMNAFGFAVILGRLLDVGEDFRKDEYEEVMLIYIMGFLLFVFIINFIFLFCMNQYHKYLGLRYGTQIPKFIQTRQLPPPNTSHTTYNNDYGHATNHNDYDGY